MTRKLCSLLLMGLAWTGVRAQELNCKVQVQHAKIQNVDPQVFRTMERSISEFMNTRKWTGEEYAANERIDINVMFNITSKPDVNEDVYTATLNIQSSRPVYNSGYTSPTINFIDRDIVFKYAQFTPLQFDDNRISGNDALSSNLTAVLAYYAYLVIGLDYDSFSPNGGSAYLKKAQNVVNNAPEQGNSIPGWKAVEGNKNRFWVIDQLLSPRFSQFRSTWYAIHREGLDNMYSKPEDSRKKFLEAVNAMSQLQKENPGAILIQFFFNAKSNEFLNIMAQVPREERAPYLTKLMQVDVPNAARYESLNNK